jgi:hypothetical protein
MMYREVDKWERKEEGEICKKKEKRLKEGGGRKWEKRENELKREESKGEKMSRCDVEDGVVYK